MRATSPDSNLGWSKGWCDPAGFLGRAGNRWIDRLNPAAAVHGNLIFPPTAKLILSGLPFFQP